jgi:hypothetical protein
MAHARVLSRPRAYKGCGGGATNQQPDSEAPRDVMGSGALFSHAN